MLQRRLGFTLTNLVARYSIKMMTLNQATQQFTGTLLNYNKVERPMLRFVIKDVDHLFEEYSQQDVFHDRTDLRETSWQTREFAFYDLDQNGLTFYCDL